MKIVYIEKSLSELYVELLFVIVEAFLIDEVLLGLRNGRIYL